MTKTLTFIFNPVEIIQKMGNRNTTKKNMIAKYVKLFPTIIRDFESRNDEIIMLLLNCKKLILDPFYILMLCWISKNRNADDFINYIDKYILYY